MWFAGVAGRLSHLVSAPPGGLVQLLAGMWEMWKGNTFGATAFSSYGLALVTRTS